MKVIDKKAKDIRVIVAGVGAAGTACTKMMLALGVRNVIGFDRQGALVEGRENMNPAKEAYAAITNPEKLTGTIKENMPGTDVFVGLSGPGIIDVEDIKSMAENPIVFAMSNPEPEIFTRRRLSSRGGHGDRP